MSDDTIENDRIAVIEAAIPNLVTKTELENEFLKRENKTLRRQRGALVSAVAAIAAFIGNVLYVFFFQ